MLQAYGGGKRGKRDGQRGKKKRLRHIGLMSLLCSHLASSAYHTVPQDDVGQNVAPVCAEAAALQR